jgi:hypothetical protein
MMKTDPVSETVCSIVFFIIVDDEKIQKLNNSESFSRLLPSCPYQTVPLVNRDLPTIFHTA